MRVCGEIHGLFNRMQRFSFPFDYGVIPTDGIYVLFERGETAHGVDRIVRIGTHTGTGKLRSRLMEHFVKENKDRSIFRKNIGRALLQKNCDRFLEQWNLDLTKSAEKDKHTGSIDFKRQTETEKKVSEYIQSNVSFVVFEVPDKADRLRLESALISTVFQCNECQPSEAWLGRFSPKPKIVQAGMWLVNELNKTPLTNGGVDALRALCFGKKNRRRR
jgi:hypothetical protein